MSPTAEWRKLAIAPSELRLSTVLRCGQAFRWRRTGGDDANGDDGDDSSSEWTCALAGRILSLKQDATHLYYRAAFPTPEASASTLGTPSTTASSTPSHDSGISLSPPDTDTDTSSSSADSTAALIRDYFNLHIPLSPLYSQWSAADPHFSSTSARFSGVRVLRQDPWETTIAFICSSNNHITRISSMVSSLCTRFGPYLGTLRGERYHDFPSPSILLAHGDTVELERELRELGFGYRARYVARTAAAVARERPPGWLRGLRDLPYPEAREALLGLAGVGPKVADCVCLMALDKKEAVPVDTHVWQIATRDYGFRKSAGKTLSAGVYHAVGEHFRTLWGMEAGWAHSVLFAADLRAFKEVKGEGEVKVEVKKEVELEVKQGAEVKVEEQIDAGAGAGTHKVVAKSKRKRKSAKLEAESADPTVVSAVVEETTTTTTTTTTRRTRVKKEPPDSGSTAVKEEAEHVDPDGVEITTAERVKRRRRGNR